MKDNNTFINGDSEPQCGVHPETTEIIVSLPDRGNIKKAFTFDINDKVWAAKQIVINEMCKGLRDVFNYGFYDPPFNGRSGKFLEEERPLKDYPLKGPHVEFKYKRRVYRSMNFDEKALQKVHTKGNLRRLMDCVASNSVNQVIKLTEKGLDPNYQDDRTGETPLTAAAVKDERSDLIMALVNGGAHLDFRAKDSQTALHRAAAAGKVFSVKTLLDLGASTNYKDAKGLTPLYYTVLHSANPYCCEILLNDHAEFQIVDHQGMQEIHQACKNGLVQHLEHLLFYGANIDARTASGNTALHITALSNHEECARVLLFRGAKRDVLNYANQSAYEVAAVAGNKSLAELIKHFDDESIVKVTRKPSYSTRRRKSASKPTASSLFNQPSTEQQLSAKSMDSLLASTDSSLSSLSNNSDPVTNGEKIRRTFSITSSASDSSYCSEEESSQLSPPPDRSIRTGPPSRPASVSSIGSVERAAPPVKSVAGAATIRKSVNSTIPGKRFKAVSDYFTEMPGELILQKGDIVEVLYVGEKGFWEGRVGDRTGWFPHTYVQEYKEKEKHRPKTLFGRPPTFSSVFTKSDPQINVSTSPKNEAPKVVSLQKTEAGYGFQMRGANSHGPRLNFKPTPEFPALQYFGDVEKGGEAYTKGIRCGDFILEVNGEDVTTATHNRVVELIKKSGDTVTLKVISAPRSPALNGTLSQVNGKLTADKYGSLSRISTNPPPIPPSRHPSTTLTLGRMKSSSRPSLNEMGIQHSFDDPNSFQVDSVITVSKENRWHTLQKQKPPSGKKASVKKESSSRQRSNSSSGPGSSKTYQRSISMQNIRQPLPTHESAVSSIKAVPFPTVPVGSTLPRTKSDSAKSTPDILSAFSEPKNITHSTGPETLPKPRKETPISFEAPDHYRQNRLDEKKSGLPTEVTINDRPKVLRSNSQPVVNINSNDESPLTRTDSTVENEKEKPTSKKNVSLSDALQMAIAERNTRQNKQQKYIENQETRKEKNVSATAQLISENSQPSEEHKTLESIENAVDSLESSEKSPNENHLQHEEAQTRNVNELYHLTGVESVQSKIEKLEKQPLSEENVNTFSSQNIYRHSFSPSHKTKKQFSFDMPPSSPPSDQKLSQRFSTNDAEALHHGRQSLNKATVFIPPPPPPIMPPTNVSTMPVLPRPQIKRIEAKLDIPMTAVRSGLVDGGSLRTQKGLLKSVTTEGSKKSFKRHKKGPKSPLKESATMSLQHSNLLAKAVAARAARMAAEERDEETGVKSDDEFAEPLPGKKDIIPSSRVETKSPTKVLNSPTRKAKVPPPVMPKRVVSPRKIVGKEEKQTRSDSAESLPFSIPAPILSEEDKTLVLLDEVLRHEAESENWSLNSWNSSDSGTDLIVPPPFFPTKNVTEEENEVAQNSDQCDQSSTPPLPRCEQRSESEEGLTAENSKNIDCAPGPIVNLKEGEPKLEGLQNSSVEQQESTENGKAIARQIPIKIGNKQISISVITHSPLPIQNSNTSPPPIQQKPSLDSSVVKNESKAASINNTSPPPIQQKPSLDSNVDSNESKTASINNTSPPIQQEPSLDSSVDKNESKTASINNTSPPIQQEPSLDSSVDKNESKTASINNNQVVFDTPVPNEPRPVSVDEVSPVTSAVSSAVTAEQKTSVSTTEVSPLDIVEASPVTTTQDLNADRDLIEKSMDDIFELPPPPVVFNDLDCVDGEVPDSPSLPPPPEFCLFTEDGTSNGNGSVQLVKPCTPPPDFALEEENEVNAPSLTDIPAFPSSPEEKSIINSVKDKPLLTWTCKNVCDWLESIGMAQYRTTFEENDIRGIHLPELTKAELRELGVKSLGHRMTIENSIAQLCHPLESSC